MQSVNSGVTAAIPYERSSDNYMVISPEMVEDFLVRMQQKGLTQETLKIYRRSLSLLYENLPEEKEIRRGTLDHICSELEQEGYALQTTNRFVTVTNNFMDHCGRREFQTRRKLQLEQEAQPELTRTEYLRLLSTAKALGKERTYLLVKTFAVLGLNIQDLGDLTVETVEHGYIKSGDTVLRIPECLRRELLSYTGRELIREGPVFVTASGKQMRRSNITQSIQNLSRDAQVDLEKCNPRCLKKLYQATQNDIKKNLMVLLEQAHERILEQEQLTVGWG